MGRNRALGNPLEVVEVTEDFTTDTYVDTYFVNAALDSPVVATLDAAARRGDQVVIQDVGNNAAAQAITILASDGQTILNGYGDSISITTDGGGVLLTFSDVLGGWVPTLSATVAPVPGGPMLSVANLAALAAVPTAGLSRERSPMCSRPNPTGTSTSEHGDPQCREHHRRDGTRQLLLARCGGVPAQVSVLAFGGMDPTGATDNAAAFTAIFASIVATGYVPFVPAVTCLVTVFRRYPAGLAIALRSAIAFSGSAQRRARLVHCRCGRSSDFVRDCGAIPTGTNGVAPAFDKAYPLLTALAAIVEPGGRTAPPADRAGVFALESAPTISPWNFTGKTQR